MKVFVVDPHPIYRQGIVATIRAIDGIRDVGDTGSVDEARTHAALADSDVVVLDAVTPGAEELIGDVRAGGGRVLVCTAAAAAEAARLSLAAGAGGLLAKATLTPAALEAAVLAIASGSTVVAPEFLGALAPAVEPEPAEPARGPAHAGPLSRREREVLSLIAEGHLTRDVARELCYSERTIKNVLHDIVTKLNVRSRSQAVAYAIRAELI